MFKSILRYLSYLAKKSYLMYGTMERIAVRQRDTKESILRLPVDKIDICRKLAAT